MRGRRASGRLATGLGALAAVLCLADEGRVHRRGGLREGSTRVSAHAGRGGGSAARGCGEAPWGGAGHLHGREPEALGPGQITEDLLAFQVGVDSPRGEAEPQDPSPPPAPLRPPPAHWPCLHVTPRCVLLGFVPCFKLANFNIR